MDDHNGRYILDDAHRAVPEPDLFKWAMWMETGDRLVKRDGDEASGWVVSTVFLGLDHRYGDGPPMLFETMVFAPDAYRGKGAPPIEVVVHTSKAFREKWDGHGARYSTWDEAEAGHRRIIEEIGRDLAIEQA